MINARESRRMFASCVMRSGRMPSLLRTGRGPELKNALMAEYCAIVGVGRRFGTPCRPVEQGLVENKHKETQKIFGMLVADIMNVCRMKLENYFIVSNIWFTIVQVLAALLHGI